jgi:predicted phosphoribosyltransferase
MKSFIDRYEAGKILAHELQEYKNKSNIIVLALPRGGVPVAYEVAKSLSAPLDVFIVRKLGVPGHEELAMGAIAMEGTVVFNDEIVNTINIPKTAIDQVIKTENEELKRREITYRGNRPFPELRNKTIILVDDGIATGATMRAAVQAIRKHKPASIIIAVPVSAISTCDEMKQIADQVICPLKPEIFYSVGQWYQDFSQTSDEEVYELLNKGHP